MLDHLQTLLCGDVTPERTPAPARRFAAPTRVTREDKPLDHRDDGSHLILKLCPAGDVLFVLGRKDVAAAAGARSETLRVVRPQAV